METILIATDFTPAARNAAKYGFELARRMRAKAILFTAYQMPFTIAGSELYVADEDVEKATYQRLFDEAAAIDLRRTVALETQALQGPVTQSILAAAEKNKVTHIVVGMKDAGKEIRRYVGSTVTALCKRSTVPVIVVPADAAFAVPKSIALASDINDETDMHILEPLKTIAERFSSNLYLVRVITRGMNEVIERTMRSERLTLFLKSLHTTFEFRKSNNVASALNDFVAKNSVDMVAVIPHEHTLFQRIFTRSVTKELVFEARVPLLVLPSKNPVIAQELNDEVYNSKHLYEIY